MIKTYKQLQQEASDTKTMHKQEALNVSWYEAAVRVAPPRLAVLLRIIDGATANRPKRVDNGATLGQVRALGSTHLLRLKGFGKHCLLDLTQILKAHGLDLPADPS